MSSSRVAGSGEASHRTLEIDMAAYMKMWSRYRQAYKNGTVFCNKYTKGFGAEVNGFYAGESLRLSGFTANRSHFYVSCKKSPLCSGTFGTITSVTGPARFTDLRKWARITSVLSSGGGSVRSGLLINHDQRRYLFGNRGSGLPGEDGAESSSPNDDERGGDGSESGSPPLHVTALTPMMVPEVFPNVPLIAVTRNPVFPRFIKIIEVVTMSYKSLYEFLNLIGQNLLTVVPTSRVYINALFPLKLSFLQQLSHKDLYSHMICLL